jgi:hypothetical protein
VYARRARIFVTFFYALVSLLQVLVILGALMATVVHDAIFGVLAESLQSFYVLSSESAGDFQAWASSSNANSAVISSRFYVYNITNPDEVRAITC